MEIRRKSIEEQGFAIIPDVFDTDDISRVLSSLAEAMLNRSKAGIRHALKYPAVAEIAQDARLLDLAKAVLGDNALPFRATLFDKSPHSNWLVVWHQDTALPLRERKDVSGWGPWSIKDGVIYAHAPASALSRVLAIRVHLDDSTALNGPLRVLPATHNLGVLNDDMIHRLGAETTAVECSVPKGGVLAMSPLIIHASSKSQTENSRRVLHIEYAHSEVIADNLRLAIT